MQRRRSSHIAYETWWFGCRRGLPQTPKCVIQRLAMHFCPRQVRVTYFLALSASSDLRNSIDWDCNQVCPMALKLRQVFDRESLGDVSACFTRVVSDTIVLHAQRTSQLWRRTVQQGAGQQCSSSIKPTHFAFRDSAQLGSCVQVLATARKPLAKTVEAAVTRCVYVKAVQLHDWVNGCCLPCQSLHFRVQTT